MSARIDPDRLEAWSAFLHAHAQVVNNLEAELEAERGLPLTWYEVLLFLNKAPGGLRMNDLADALVLSRSGLTRVIDRMVTAGLVERAECSTDRRGVMAVITPNGRRALKDASPIHMRGVKEHFTDHLSGSEARTLRRVFRKILDADQKAEAS
jgi:DNA-binding MarR family transcriptional regulator